jgi:hypothetical protein
MSVDPPVGRDSAPEGPTFRAPGVETEEPSRGFLPGVLRFFFVPLLLVGASLAVFAGLGALVAQGPAGTNDLVRQIAEGGKNARWQAAQELSNQVARGEVDLRRDASLSGAVTEAFRKARSDGDDPRVLQHLAVLLGRSGQPQAGAALVEALADGSPDVRIYATAGLAEFSDPATVDAIARGLQDLDPGVRAVSAYAAAAIAADHGGAGSALESALVAALEDPSVDVRWNAALALARLGRPQGADLLWKMLHRDYVRASLRKGDGGPVVGLFAAGGTDPSTPEEIETLVVRNALSAAWRLRDRSMVGGVKALAASDPDHGVRDWAMKTRDLLEREIADRGPVAAREWTAATAK